MYRIQRSFISSVIFLCLMIPHLGVTVFAQNYCDPELNGSEGDPLSYQLRGDRCTPLRGACPGSRSFPGKGLYLSDH